MKKISFRSFLLTTFLFTLSAIAADIEQGVVDRGIEKQVEEIMALSGGDVRPKLKQALTLILICHPPSYELFKQDFNSSQSNFWKKTDEELSGMITGMENLLKDKTTAEEVNKLSEEKADELFKLGHRKETPERRTQIIEWLLLRCKTNDELELRFEFLKDVWGNPNFYMFTKAEDAEKMLKLAPTKLVFYLSSMWEGSFTMVGIKNNRKKPSKIGFRVQRDRIDVHHGNNLKKMVNFGESRGDAFDRLVNIIQTNYEYNDQLRQPAQFPEMVCDVESNP